jgi:hypothetical protein
MFEADKLIFQLIVPCMASMQLPYLFADVDSVASTLLDSTGQLQPDTLHHSVLLGFTSLVHRV